MPMTCSSSSLPVAPPAAASEARDWAALPRDIVLDVFFRLSTREIMLGPELACTAWRLAALEEPTLWRRVDGYDYAAEQPRQWLFGERTVEMERKLAAVHRAAGECEAFEGHSYDDDYPMELVERAPLLKSLDIQHYNDYQSGEELVDELKKLTLLEDLQIYFRYVIRRDDNLLQPICHACPHLKKLVLIYASALDFECAEDQFSNVPVDGEIPMMHKLRSLELYDCELSCKGLKSILDSCPLLETLYISGYFNRHEMDKELRVKCARIKDLSLPRGNKCDNSYYNNYSEDYDSQEEENSYY